MFSFLEPYILWIKVIHVVSIIAWMAGLFYLPRLFVYHVKNVHNLEMAETFKLMEKRLYVFIMQPAMIFSLLTGGIIATIENIWSFGWIHLKLLAVISLLIFHLMLNHWRYNLAANNCSHGERFFRIINEIPTLLLIIIVICVKIKPF